MEPTDYHVQLIKPGETENPQQLNEIYYNCSECSSPIEIISINEKDNIIEFECINNKHNIKISIKEYINKMKRFNDKNINNDICIEHNNKYECICLECNKHLCKECLKTRKHINHQKINIIEIQPNDEALKLIDNIINKYEDNIKELERKNTETNEKIKNKYEKVKKELNDKKELKLKENQDKLKNELNINNNKYILDINKLKEKYEKDIKISRM